jgi:hypothetical protein
MAAIGTIAQKRGEILGRILEALGMDLPIPPTKVQPIVTEAIYLEILAELAKRVVSLERSCSRGRNSHAER